MQPIFSVKIMMYTLRIRRSGEEEHECQHEKLGAR